MTLRPSTTSGAAAVEEDQGFHRGGLVHQLDQIGQRQRAPCALLLGDQDQAATGRIGSQ